MNRKPIHTTLTFFTASNNSIFKQKSQKERTKLFHKIQLVSYINTSIILFTHHGPQRGIIWLKGLLLSIISLGVNSTLLVENDIYRGHIYQCCKKKKEHCQTELFRGNFSSSSVLVYWIFPLLGLRWNSLHDFCTFCLFSSGLGLHLYPLVSFWKPEKFY